MPGVGGGADAEPWEKRHMWIRRDLNIQASPSRTGVGDVKSRVWHSLVDLEWILPENVDLKRFNHHGASWESCLGIGFLRPTL